MRIASVSTGFVDVPGKISLNIFAQGCKKRCQGCQNPELQPFDGGEDVSLEDMSRVLDERTLSTWICWLGGDATYQEDEFIKFNKLFKERGYKICLYTGQKFQDVENILENVDLVIDGEWEGKTVSDEESNQKCYLKKEKWEQINYNNLEKEL